MTLNYPFMFTLMNKLGETKNQNSIEDETKNKTYAGDVTCPLNYNTCYTVPRNYIHYMHTQFHLQQCTVNHCADKGYTDGVEGPIRGEGHSRKCV